MKRFFLILILLVVSLGCTKRAENTVSSEGKQSNLYNISAIKELKHLKKTLVIYESYDVKKTVYHSPELKDIFVTISFPFSFNIKEAYVTKGSKVKKGDRLFLISSEEMLMAYETYKKTKEPNIEQKFLSIGITLDNEPPQEILIISPDEGTVVFTYQEGLKNSLNIQNTLAIIQKTGELMFNILIPSDIFKNETHFYANFGEKILPLTVISTESFENAVKISLSLKGFDISDELQNIPITIVNTMQNIYKIPKNSVLIEGSKNFCFVEVSENILEKREINGFTEEDFFIVTEGLRQAEKVVIEDANMLKRAIKI